MKNKAIFLILIIFLSIFISSGCAKKQKMIAPKRIPVKVALPKYEQISSYLEFMGTITPYDISSVAITIPSSVKAKIVHVREGDFVRKGTKLVTMEKEDLNAQVEQADALYQAAIARYTQSEETYRLQRSQSTISIAQAQEALKAAEAQLKQSVQAKEFQEHQTKAQIKQASEALDSARANLLQLETGFRPQEKYQAEKSLASAKAELENAKLNLQRMKVLFQQGAVAKATLDTATLQYDVAYNRYQTALAQRSLIMEGSRQEQISMARSAVKQAEANLSLAKANIIQNQVREQAVNMAKSQYQQAIKAYQLAKESIIQIAISYKNIQANKAAVLQAKASLDYAKNQLDKADLLAPISGVIVKRNINPGEVPSRDNAIFVIQDLSTIYVEIDVNERHIEKIKLQMPVSFNIDALAGEAFTGKVKEIIPSADLKSRTFKVRIIAENPQFKIKAGLFGRVRVVDQVRPKALVIPVEGVQRRNEKDIIFTVKNDKSVMKPVTVGITDGKSIEIVSGLTPEEPVIVLGAEQFAGDEEITIPKNNNNK